MAWLILQNTCLLWRISILTQLQIALKSSPLIPWSAQFLYQSPNLRKDSRDYKDPYLLSFALVAAVCSTTTKSYLATSALPSAQSVYSKDIHLVIYSNAMPLQRPSRPGIYGSILSQSSNFFPLSLLSLPFFLLTPSPAPSSSTSWFLLILLPCGAFYAPSGAGGKQQQQWACEQSEWA